MLYTGTGNGNGVDKDDMQNKRFVMIHFDRRSQWKNKEGGGKSMKQKLERARGESLTFLSQEKVKP